MNKNIYFIMIIMIVLIIGCDKEVTFEESFHQKMEQKMEQKEDIEYTLVHHKTNLTNKNNAVAVFVEHRIEKDIVFIAYFEKEENKWEWKGGNGHSWEHQYINWTNTQRQPYIYSGAISDDAVAGVLVKQSKATIIDIEGNKQFWYAIGDNLDEVVKYIYQDGTEEVIESVGE